MNKDENQIKKQDLSKLKFLCLEPTQVKLDGLDTTVKAFCYLDYLEKEYPNCTEHEKRAWKFYSFGRAKQIELISELELEKRIGTEVFTQLN